MKPSLIIDSDKYFVDKYKTNDKYKIYIIQKNNFNFFEKTLNDILIKLKKNNITFGLDFEFNKVNDSRQVALFQISIDDDVIIMFNPLELTDNLVILLKNVLLDKNAIKIMHGSESLDYIYLFETFFIDLEEKKLFVNNFYDTKFLCEYENIFFKKENKKCKIYKLLLKNNIIDDNIYDWLIENEEKMGPIWNIVVDVNNMSEALIYYTLFDVFYLKKLLNSFKLQKNIIDSVSQILQVIFVYKSNIEEVLKELNNFNINYFFTDNNLLLLNNVFNYYKGWLNDNDNIINNCYNIPYFKKFLDFMLKKVIYTNLSNKYKIYEKKNITSKLMYNNFEKDDFYKDFNRIENLYKVLDEKLKKDLSYFF